MEFVRKLDFVDKFWPKMESLNRDFPYGVVHILRHQEGGEGFQMMTSDYEGYRGGGLADDYMIKNIYIFDWFSPNFGPVLLWF